MGQLCQGDNYIALQKTMLDERQLDSRCGDGRTAIRGTDQYADRARGLSH